MSAVAGIRTGPGMEEILSERLGEAFRQDDLHQVNQLSPYVACVMPILKGLGWQARGRDVIDSLPHFADHFDLVDLLNVLVHLGYQSDPKRTRLVDVDEALLPCLFVGDDGELLVATSRKESEITCFDANSLSESVRTAPQTSGTAYVFTNLDEEQALAAPASSNSTWFVRLLTRFRTIFVHLLVMSTLINILALSMPFFILAVYDRVIGVGSSESLPYLIAGICIALLAELALRYLRTKSLGLMAGRMDYLIGVETFRHLLFLPPLMTERAAVSSQLARLRQFDTVRNFFAGQGALALLDLPFVFVFLLVMGSISGPIVLVPVIMLIAYAVFAAVWLPILNEQVAAAGTAKTLRTRRLMDTLTGMRELKALGAEAPWRDTCHEAVSTSVMEDYRTAHAHVIVNTVSQSAQTIAAVAVLGLGAQAVMQGDMTVGMLIAVMTLLWRVLAPLQTLFLTYVNFDQTAQVVRQMNQLMRLDTEHRSPRASLLIPKLKGAIRFERASFRYGPDADPALLGASFNIEPGEFVVIIGGNGCGKSTILKLAMGLYHPQAGAVSIDKLDLRQFNASDLHRGVAYVPQQPKLFYGTVAQNLRLADPGATIKQLEEACEMAGILQIIRDDLPQGFDTKIGDHETNRLQSGLVHGICMARAFLRDAPILLLDEPGSSLDEAADQRLVSRLRALHGSRTIVMVSHRPSHIRLADKVITMDRGMITSIGTPEEALAAYFKS